jgi:hypothetical protein
VYQQLMATTLHQHTAQWVAHPIPEAADWIAFDALTEADVLAWVWASVDKDTTEASLAAKIEADKNPTSSTGMPWAAE